MLAALAAQIQTSKENAGMNCTRRFHMATPVGQARE